MSLQALMKLVYRLCVTAMVLHTALTVYAAPGKPLAAVLITDDASPRTRVISRMMTGHLANILSSTGVFGILDAELLRKEIEKYGCTGEPCMLRFAGSVSLDLLIRVRIEDRPGYSSIELTGHGLKYPFNGKIIARYHAVIPFGRGDTDLREMQLLSEEAAGLFIAKLLRQYRRPLLLRRSTKGEITVDAEVFPDGGFTVMRPLSLTTEKDVVVCSPVVKLTFKGGRAVQEGGNPVMDGDIILYGYVDKADFIDAYYYGRKKEMVLSPPSGQDTLFAVLFTAPASASMPVMSPLGYYTYGDYAGLLLWAVNAAPYLYLETRGLTNSPGRLREERHDVSRDAVTRYYFGMYMLLAGGLPLFVDAFSHEYLSRASRYDGVQPLMGNTMTAVYLSAVSGGAGHFYRGRRLWGYFYFHLHNVLLYLTMREFIPNEKYDPVSGRHEKGTIDKERAWCMLGLLGTVKIAELAHVIFSRDRLRSGIASKGGVSVEPFVLFTGDSGMTAGISGVYRW